MSKDPQATFEGRAPSSLDRAEIRRAKLGEQNYWCPSWAGRNCKSLDGGYDLFGPFPRRSPQDVIWIVNN